MDNLDPDFTIRENLQIYGRYFDLSATEVDARIPALLEFAGLASRGDDAVRLAKQQRPDLVLLDMMMPRMDGLAFARDPRGTELELTIRLSAAGGLDAQVRASKRLSASAPLLGNECS